MTSWILAAVTSGEVVTVGGGLSLLGIIGFLIRTIIRQRNGKVWGGFSLGGNGNGNGAAEAKAVPTQGVCPAHEGMVLVLRNLSETQVTLLEGQNAIHKELQDFNGKIDAVLAARGQQRPVSDLRGIPS